ncbi:MAG: protein kinase [Leptolyngbyaceae cyanobacterium]
MNPNCKQPNNRDTAENCRTCGTPLVKLLRGRYRPIRLLGRGGFGRTYLAEDWDRLNAPCVIKQFAPQAQGDKAFKKAVQLFNQEAVRLHELGEHSQIPALLAYFEQDQYLYLVQQFIDGKTLMQEIVQQGPLDEAGIRNLLRDLLPVLDFIHSHSVVHRDITPTNIIRRETDRRIFLIDFGIAKQFGDALLLIEPGTRIGTEGYAPIEQLRGGHAYPCSDLYSLGATCLHLLTGCKPERLYDPMNGCWRWREYLSQQGLTFSEELGQVLDRLVKDLVSDRYQTATEVLTRLVELPSLTGNVPGWVRQRPTGRLYNSNQDPQSPDESCVTSPQEETSTAITSAPELQLEPASEPISAGPHSAETWDCINVLKGHTSWVTTVAFSPSNPTLVSGSLDDTIKVWDLRTGNTIFTLTGHRRGINEIVISAKGQVLVSCGDDNTIQVWNLSTGRRLHTLQGHGRGVTSVAIGHQGWLLVSGSKDRTIKIWKLDKGVLTKTLSDGNSAIKCIALTPDEQFILGGGLDNKIRQWDIRTGQIVKTFSSHLSTVNCISVSKNGLFFASASKDKTVRLWSIGTGSMIHCLKGHLQEVSTVEVAPDNRTVISGSVDGSIKFWDAKTGKLKSTQKEQSSTVESIAIHKTGKLIATAGANKNIYIYKNSL